MKFPSKKSFSLLQTLMSLFAVVAKKKKPAHLEYEALVFVGHSLLPGIFPLALKTTIVKLHLKKSNLDLHSFTLQWFLSAKSVKNESLNNQALALYDLVFAEIKCTNDINVHWNDRIGMVKTTVKWEHGW